MDNLQSFAVNLKYVWLGRRPVVVSCVLSIKIYKKSSYTKLLTKTFEKNKVYESEQNMYFLCEFYQPKDFKITRITSESMGSQKEVSRMKELELSWVCTYLHLFWYYVLKKLQKEEWNDTGLHYWYQNRKIPMNIPNERINSTKYEIWVPTYEIYVPTNEICVPTYEICVSTLFQNKAVT